MTNDSSSTQRYERTTDVLATGWTDQLVLLDTQNWAYFEFDKTASTIWALLERPHTLPSLVEALRDKFHVDEERCLQDTKKFLDDMVAQGLVIVLAA